jgi:hypothetical protein
MKNFLKYIYINKMTISLIKQYENILKILPENVIQKLVKITNTKRKNLYIYDNDEKDGWENENSYGGIKWYNCDYIINKKKYCIKIGYLYHIHNNIDVCNGEKNIEYFSDIISY